MSTIGRSVDTFSASVGNMGIEGYILLTDVILSIL